LIMSQPEYALRPINPILETVLPNGARRVYVLGQDPPRAAFVRRRRVRSLDAKRSLEAIVASFPGAIVVDPTGAFARARLLIEAAQRANERACGKLIRLYLSPQGCTLLARVRQQADQAEVGSLLAETLADALAPAGFGMGIRVSVNPPPQDYLPVLRWRPWPGLGASPGWRLWREVWAPARPSGLRGPRSVTGARPEARRGASSDP
jgi:hypothetical protein